MLENLKTILLLTVLTVMMVIVGDIIGNVFGYARIGSIIGLLIALGINFYSYYNSDKIAVRSYNARIVTEQESPNLHRIISDLANRADIKKPRIAVIQSNDPNAFATGRNQDNAVVAVTSGLLNLLDEDELRGVLSHELGHIKNSDILIGSIVAGIAGAITLIASMGRFAGFFVGGEDDYGNIIAALAIAILAPIAATLIQLCVSRNREYKADATGARICGKPLALASALRKIEFGTIQNPMRNAKPSDAHMFIMNPFGNAKSTMQNLFSTHPSTADRISKLEQMEREKSYL